jgi:glycosyltransferase involved in cell wall biosynthesis
MRVAIMSSFRKNCGIGIYTFNFLSNLLKYEYENIEEIYLLTHTNSDVELASKKLKTYKVINEQWPLYTSKLYYLLKKINADVINIEWDHSLYSPTMLLGTYIFPLLSNFKDKIFLSFHSLYRLEDIERALAITTGSKIIGKIGSKYYFITKKFLLDNHKIGRVFTLYEYEQVKKLSRKFVTIHQGIENIKKLMTPRKNKINLTIFGFIRPTKDYKLALNSLSLLPNTFRLIIAGQPKDTRLINKIKNWVDEFNVRDRVVIIPRFLSPEEKEKIMKKTDILLLPYLLISNSGVLLDGIKYCKPVVSTVLPKDITQLKIGAYAENDAQSFTEAILAVNSRYKEFLENIKRVQPKFLWKNIIPQIIEAYQKILDK